MYIKVKVHTHAKDYLVIKRSENSYEVSVKEKPENGRSNDAVLQLLAAHLHFDKGKMRIVKGGTKPSKIIEIVYV